MILTKLLIVFTINLSIQGNNNCENLATLIYEDLTCKPRLGPDGCASSYDCSHRRPKEGYCLFKGVYYKVEESINGTGVCNPRCFCSAESGKKSSIKCDIVTCSKVPSQCYYTYKTDSCCHSGKQCPPFDNLATCEYDGRTIREGERFSPKDTCDTCICEKGYKGVYEEPFCRRRKCDVEISNPEEIEANCAPAYFKNYIKCCPVMFMCPEKSVVENLESGEKDSTVKCKFGTREFNVKDKFILKYDASHATHNSQNASCSCIIPPFVTCEI